MVDLTARKQAEEQWRRSDARLRLVIESVTNYAIFTVDSYGLIETWNRGATRMFGYSEEEIVGQPVGVLFTADDRANGADQLEMTVARDKGQSLDERWHLRKDSSRFFASGMLAGLRGHNDELIGFVKIARDLTERKNWEDALRTAHDELESRVEQRTSELAEVNASLDSELREHRQSEERVRALLGRLMTVQEDERRRIARDLHDHLGQQVAGLSLSMQALETVARDRDDLRKRVQDAQAIIARLDRDLDFFTWELRPPVLDDLGVPIALEHFVQEWSKNFDIPSEYHTRGFEKIRLGREIKTASTGSLRKRSTTSTSTRTPSGWRCSSRGGATRPSWSSRTTVAASITDEDSRRQRNRNRSDRHGRTRRARRRHARDRDRTGPGTHVFVRVPHAFSGVARTTGRRSPNQ